MGSVVTLLCSCGSGESARAVPNGDEQPKPVALSPSVNQCPTLRGSLVLPVEIPPAVDAAVFVQATDPDGDSNSIVYAWSADSGTFSRPESPYTTYRCSEPGPRALRLSARDSSGCFRTFDVNVRCLER